MHNVMDNGGPALGVEVATEMAQAKKQKQHSQSVNVSLHNRALV